MDLWRSTLALGLPWLTGVVWLRYKWTNAPRGAWAMVLGYGYVAGMLFTTLLMKGLDVLGVKQSFLLPAWILATCVLVGLWVNRALPFKAWAAGNPAARERSGPAGSSGDWESWVFVLLCLVLLYRTFGLGVELAWRPLFAWDAWATWAPKARVWFEHLTLVPFVDWSTWLERGPGDAYTLAAFHYPSVVPLIQLWMTLALDRWDDSLMNLPWLLCLVALGLAFYGQCRIWGVRPLLALVFTYFLLSLPVLNTQVALAGQADLWMATAFGLASFAFFQWWRTGSRRQGLLALGFALACSQIKVPGVVWMLVFLPAVFLPRLSRFGVFAGSVASLAVTSLVWLWGGLNATIPGLGSLDVGSQGVDLPYLGAHGWQMSSEAGPAVLSSTLGLDNWHLFWYGFLLLFVLSVPRLLATPVFKSMTLLTVSSFVFLFGVYFLSSSSRFAVDFTQFNRALLHAIPMLHFVGLALLQDRFKCYSPLVDPNDSYGRKQESP